MPQSLAAVQLHLVFSTYERRALLRDPVVRSSLYAQLASISHRLDAPLIGVNGTQDHVHLLARFGRTQTIAEWVKELKRVSSTWLKEQGRAYESFRWQSGYACFSVSHSSIDRVVEYIARQEEHHRTLSFQDELRSILTKHQIEFDELYVWE